MFDSDVLLSQVRKNKECESVNIDVLHVIDSTNSELKRRLRNRVIDGKHVLIAENQLHGRGRRGKVWKSPYGRSIALSVLFTGSRSAEYYHGLSLAVGYFVVQAISKYTDGHDIKIKWPNDIYNKGKKIAGVLIEAIHQPNKPIKFIVGIGINIALNHSELNSIDQPAGNLIVETDSSAYTRIAKDIICELFKGFSEFEINGLLPLIPNINNISYLKDMNVDIEGNGQKYSGLVLGINSDGTLSVRIDNVQKKFSSGSVSVRCSA